jgi:RimJ/RimL family protein N-acetyltransferase
MPPGNWFPERLTGDLVVLRRHVPANLKAFQRWYSDAEVARLTRYQDGPMRRDEIERFFAARVVGHDSLALAVHERTTDRLIGTCAFSQLDGENGSAMYHITIGEKDCWGRGYGTEATRLMLAHAFETLRLHRVALAVFEFNERAIRSYRSCGFVIEGRATCARPSGRCPGWARTSR